MKGMGQGKYKGYFIVPENKEALKDYWRHITSTRRQVEVILIGQIWSNFKIKNNNDYDF